MAAGVAADNQPTPAASKPVLWRWMIGEGGVDTTPLIRRERGVMPPVRIGFDGAIITLIYKKGCCTFKQIFCRVPVAFFVMFFVVVWPPPCWRRTRRAASTGFLVQYLA